MKIWVELTEVTDRELVKLDQLIQKSFAKVTTESGEEKEILNLRPGHYHVNKDGSVTFNVSVKLVENMKQLPFRVEHAADALIMSGRGITSLEGSPRSVGGWYNVSHNSFLTSLDGAPSFVGAFNASSTGITSLVGGPRTVQGDYWVNDTSLHSLEGLPDSIEGVMWMSYKTYTPLLRLPMVYGLRDGRVRFTNAAAGNNAVKVQELVNKHLGEGRKGALQLQKELMEAGFEENAKP